MHIDVWADVTCPWCYLGIRHLRAALATFEHRDEVEVALHAYLLDPELDHVVDVPRRVHLIEDGGLSIEDALDQDARLEALGRTEGVAFDFDHALVVPATNAHRVLAAAKELDLENGECIGADTVSLRLYEAFARAGLEMGLDVSDPEVVIGCAQDIGMPPERVVEALADERFASQVFSDHQIGVQMGVDLVPTYLFDRRFVVQGHQPLTAMVNIVAGAWHATTQEQQ